MKRSAISVLVLALNVLPGWAGVSEDNLQRMLDAARQLEYLDSDNRAFLLETMGSVRSPVGVIFGYADNESACEQIARALITSGVAGEFECTPIY